MPCAFFLLRNRRNQARITTEAWTAILLTTIVGAAYVRALLWGSHHHTAPIFAGSCLISYLVFKIAVPGLKWSEPISGWLSAIGIAFAAAALWHVEAKPRATLHTTKGDIRVLAHVAAPLQETLTWIETNTDRSTQIVSAPYSAGLNYLADRRSPLRQTQFTRMNLPTNMREQDVAVFDSVRNLIVVSQIEASIEMLTEARSRFDNPELWERIDRGFIVAVHFGDGAIEYIIRTRVPEHIARRQ